MAILEPRQLIALLEDLEDDLKRTQFAFDELGEEARRSHGALSEQAERVSAHLRSAYDEAEAARHKPVVVLVDDHNRPRAMPLAAAG
jgi:hypothetical protein